MRRKGADISTSATPLISPPEDADSGATPRRKEYQPGKPEQQNYFDLTERWRPKHDDFSCHQSAREESSPRAYNDGLREGEIVDFAHVVAETNGSTSKESCNANPTSPRSRGEEVANLTFQNQTLQAENETLLMQLDAANSERDSNLLPRIQSLKNDLSKAQGELYKSQAANKALKTEVEDLRRKLDLCTCGSIYELESISNTSKGIVEFSNDGGDQSDRDDDYSTISDCRHLDQEWLDDTSGQVLPLPSSTKEDVAVAPNQKKKTQKATNWKSNLCNLGAPLSEERAVRRTSATRVGKSAAHPLVGSTSSLPVVKSGLLNNDGGDKRGVDRDTRRSSLASRSSGFLPLPGESNEGGLDVNELISDIAALEDSCPIGALGDSCGSFKLDQIHEDAARSLQYDTINKKHKKFSVDHHESRESVNSRINKQSGLVKRLNHSWSGGDLSNTPKHVNSAKNLNDSRELVHSRMEKQSGVVEQLSYSWSGEDWSNTSFGSTHKQLRKSNQEKELRGMPGAEHQYSSGRTIEKWTSDRSMARTTKGKASLAGERMDTRSSFHFLRNAKNAPAF